MAQEANKMAQWVQVHATKLGKLSSIPWWKERPDTLKLSSDLYTHAECSYTQIINKQMNKYNRKEKGKMALGKYSLLGLCQELVGISKAQTFKGCFTKQKLCRVFVLYYFFRIFRKYAVYVRSTCTSLALIFIYLLFEAPVFLSFTEFFPCPLGQGSHSEHAFPLKEWQSTV